MNTINCTLFCHSISPHVQQLYTGFNMLSEAGLLEVKQILKNKTTRKQTVNLQDARQAHLSVNISCGKENLIRLYYDNHDSMEISQEGLKKHDIYFKRSFSKKYIDTFFPERKEDIYPLGLNYKVLPNRFNPLTLSREISLSNSLRDKIKALVRTCDTNNKLKFFPRARNMYSFPKEYPEKKVLFMVTAYDPYDNPDRPKEKIEERISNNEFRAKCVQLLRNKLRDKFYGGFIHNHYTHKNYKNFLLDYSQNGMKSNYIKILKNFPICIATTGLHGSIGWKLAEYVAFSKAIVSEKLRFKIPGDFRKEKNFLEFTSQDECLEQSIRLLSNERLLNDIMINNSIYYQHYVRPDMLVLNSITLALKRMQEKYAQSVAGGISPSPPPPGMRVSTRRFPKASEP